MSDKHFDKPGVMFIAAHQDDAEGTSGGLFAKLNNSRDIRGIVACFSDGSVGHYSAEYLKRPGDLTAIRDREAAEAAAVNVEGSNPVMELLRSMPQRFNAKAAEGVAAIYQFEVSGDEEFTVHIRLADQKATFHEGAAESPDVVIKTPAKVWLDIARGELSGRWAFMTRKYTVTGDIALLMKLRSLFDG